MEEIVFLNGIPAKVLCFGGLLPRDLGSNPIKSKPKQLILVIPGNPGVCEFYKRFSDHLHSLTGIPIWVAAHVGISSGIYSPDPLQKRELYIVSGQVKYFEELIVQYLQGIKVIIVGHSIGSYLTLRLLQNEECNNIIFKAFLMLPVFERFCELRNTKILKPTINFGLGFPRLTHMLAPLVNMVSRLVVRTISKHEIRNIFDGNTILAMLILVKDCYTCIAGREQIDTIRRHTDKLKIFYGADDSWAPRSFFVQLKEEIPNVDASIDNQGIPHSFQLQKAHETAELVSKWIIVLNTAE